MTDSHADPNTSGQDEAALTSRPRTYLQMVAQRTLSRPGAQVGLMWITLLVIMAVLAPFIANSHPLIFKRVGGDVEFPLFRFLRPIDVLLLIAAGAGVVLWYVPKRIRLPRAMVFIAIVIVAAPMCFWLINPPRKEVLHTYRNAIRDNDVMWIVHTPIAFSPHDRQRDTRGMRNHEPSITYWREGCHLFGTDTNSADVASNMVHGTRIAVSIGFIATGIALVIGVLIGSIMGFFVGWADLMGMRFVEVFAAIPSLLLLLTIAAVIPPEWNAYRLYAMMVAIGVTGWVGYARFTRAEFLKLRNQDFVLAARALGLPLRSILLKHMLPNGVAPVLVEASFGVAGAIISESVLSFLGIGLIDDPSWGKMLSETISGTGGFKWWMAIFPGNAIFLTVFAYILIGESLRDAIDPYVNRN
ncbi:MAG: ABC transporter permease [Planctomycetaceae bacterium]|nr:ABC transporter permease [Planctomycetaceae bacterium]